MQSGYDPDNLAVYASSERTSKGRIYDEPPPVHRNHYQRDRDRIIHSAAFRRLEYKTQVFVNHEGDLFRTRLTHSLEVSQIARSIARELRLHEDLAETIALSHDLGHAPFGHGGQDALNRCMKNYGGFEHNLQSLRVVDELEEKYAEFSPQPWAAASLGQVHLARLKGEGSRQVVVKIQRPDIRHPEGPGDVYREPGSQRCARPRKSGAGRAEDRRAA